MSTRADHAFQDNPATRALAALGHVRKPNDRCTARYAEIPKEERKPGPASPPIWCFLPLGHEGPHRCNHGGMHPSFAMNAERIVHEPLADTCAKCRTRWPCPHAEAVIAALGAPGEKLAHAQLRALQASVRFILVNAAKFEWSLQGMGFLRLHMGNTRIHIWDPSYAAPGVSMIHDHLQWGLCSTIVAGTLINQRYAEFPRAHVGATDEPYNVVTLKAGYGCKFMEEPQLVWLRPLAPETYGPGDSYEQAPREVHESKPQGVVVTVMEKSPTGSDLARVFWPVGTEWGTAEPRKATDIEVLAITQKAIAVLDVAGLAKDNP